MDKLLASLADIRLACKSMPGTNAVAYFASASVTKKKVFETFTPGACTIKIFTALINSLYARVFFSIGHFYPSQIFTSKAGAYPSGALYETLL